MNFSQKVLELTREAEAALSERFSEIDVVMLTEISLEIFSVTSP
jgi:hypothetical protein